MGIRERFETFRQDVESNAATQKTEFDAAFFRGNGRGAPRVRKEVVERARTRGIAKERRRRPLSKAMGRRLGTRLAQISRSFARRWPQIWPFSRSVSGASAVRQTGAGNRGSAWDVQSIVGGQGAHGNRSHQGPHGNPTFPQGDRGSGRRAQGIEGRPE